MQPDSFTNMKLSVVILAILGALLIDAVPLSKQAENYKVILEEPDLQDDLDDFMSLIPVKKIEDVFYQYLAEDDDVAEALDYIMSDEVKSLLIDIESMDDVKKFLVYLQSAGLDAYGFVNSINDLLGIERIHPVVVLKSKTGKIIGGLPGLLKDIQALLPMDRIEKMYNDKLKNSKAFASLIEKLESQEFQEFVDKLMANSKLQQVIERAEAKGVDVKAILDLITSLFGIKFPSRQPAFFEEEEEVIDILRQIWKQVPMDKLMDTIISYIIDDNDFQDLVTYMLSDEFKNIQLDIENMSQFKALATYLDSVGMDIYNYINVFHDVIGLPPIKHFSTDVKISGGLPGMIKDIRSVLPIDKLHKFYAEKLKSSNKFREFIERLEKNELQDLVNALGEHKGFQSWLKRLQAKGVDLDELIEIAQTIIGIKFPKPPSF